MTRTIFDMLFVACFFVPPAVVALGALSLAWPRHRMSTARAARHAHA